MVSRRQILKGVLSDRRKEFFPPWSLKPDKFLETCTRCSACIDICPQKILKKNDGGYPVVDFADASCTFCAKCADVCESGSISLGEYIGAEPWTVKAVITEFCINYHGTICRMCADSCSDRLIKFRLQKGGISIPEIVTEECTGCGECYRSCPKQAIDIKPL